MELLMSFDGGGESEKEEGDGDTGVSGTGAGEENGDTKVETGDTNGTEVETESGMGVEREVGLRTTGRVSASSGPSSFTSESEKEEGEEEFFRGKMDSLKTTSWL